MITPNVNTLREEFRDLTLAYATIHMHHIMQWFRSYVCAGKLEVSLNIREMCENLTSKSDDTVAASPAVLRILANNLRSAGFDVEVDGESFKVFRASWKLNPGD